MSNFSYHTRPFLLTKEDNVAKKHEVKEKVKEETQEIDATDSKGENIISKSIHVKIEE